MTIVRGDDGRAKVGTFKKFVFSPVPVRASYQDGGFATLTTSEIYSIEYTILEGDIPVITPEPVGVCYAPLLHVAGRGAVFGSATITYTFFKNGAQVSTGTSASVSANNSWTMSIVQSGWFASVVGDVIRVDLKAATGSPMVDLHAFSMQPTRILLTKPGVIVKDITYDYTGLNGNHVITVGRAPVASMNAGGATMEVNGATLSAMGPGNITIPYWTTKGQHNIRTDSSANFHHYSMYFGDTGYRTTNSFRTHATNHPAYDANRIPNNISFREIEVGL